MIHGYIGASSIELLFDNVAPPSAPGSPYPHNLGSGHMCPSWVVSMGA